jgi:hypothetical protein
MQVECQVAVRRAQAFAAFCNAENAVLSSKRKLFAELGRLATEFSLTDGLTATRRWVNVPVHLRLPLRPTDSKGTEE